jgi:hypothetical protein
MQETVASYQQSALLPPQLLYEYVARNIVDLIRNAWPAHFFIWRNVFLPNPKPVFTIHAFENLLSITTLTNQLTQIRYERPPRPYIL